MIATRGNYMVVFRATAERCVEAWDSTGHPMVVDGRGLVRADAVDVVVGVETRELGVVSDSVPPDVEEIFELDLPQPCRESTVLTESELEQLGIQRCEPGAFAGQRIELVCLMQAGHVGCHAAVYDGTEYDPAEPYDTWRLWGTPTAWERAEHPDCDGDPFRGLAGRGGCGVGRPLAGGAKLACTLPAGHDGAHSYELAGYQPRRRHVWRPPPPRSLAVVRRRTTAR